ncbi:MAG: hypothetical protein LBH34_03250 [Prevotellaceae bacterium]|jgi:hypothetical protein|nr:hypothetical protein [Prevotellaceae bacterium]
MLRKFLFPTAVFSNVMSLGLLLLRLTFGLSVAIFHGYGKLVNYGDRVDSFNDNFFQVL